ncbi:hypothetical protein, partial [Spirosoma sp. 48-14]
MKTYISPTCLRQQSRFEMQYNRFDLLQKDKHRSLSGCFMQILLLVGLLGLALNVQAQVSGKVFQDLNANGSQGTATPNLETGYGGITVKAFNAAG